MRRVSVTLGRRARPGLVLGLGQFALRGVTAVYSVALVHVLRPEELGDFAFLLALLGILVTVADGGFSRLLIRDVARSDGAHGDLIPRLLAVRTLWIAVTVAVGAGLLALVVAADVRSTPVVIALVLVALVAEAAATGFEAAGIGLERPWRIAGGQLAAATAMVAVLVVLLATGAGVASALAGPVVASVVKCTWHGLLWRRDLRWSAGAAPSATARRWFREATPFLVLALLGTVYARIDVLLLHQLRGAGETASYAAAYRLVDAALVIGGVAAATVLPPLSRLHRDEPARVFSEWRRLMLLTAVAAAPVVALLAMFAEPVSGFLFAERYRETAGEDLRLLAPGIAFMLLQVVNAAVLFTSDLQRLLVPMSLLHVGFNVILTWLLADAHGSTGAAAATTISEIVTVTYFGAFVWWRFGRPGTAA